MKKRVLVPIVLAIASLAFATLLAPGSSTAPAASTTSAASSGSAVAVSSTTSSGSATSAVAATPAAVSQNWAGYEISSRNGSGFSSASGEWIQPKLKCTSGQATYSAFWVGLGGGGQSSTALEQQGTQADCSASGVASYYAWYELVPSAPVKINMKISPGDRIYSRTAVNGDQVTVQVQNKTTGQNFSKTLTMTRATPDTSTAEWVAEAPSQCDSATLSNCSVLPLSDFGTVKFTNAQATSAGHTGSISDSQWTATPVALSSGASGLLGGGAGGYLGGSPYGYGSGYGSAYGSGYGYGYGSGYGSLYGTGYPGYGYSYGLAYSRQYNAPSSVTTLGYGSGGAAPSTLSSDGSSFTVTYGDTAASSTSSTGSSSSSGTGYPYSSTDPYGYSYGYYPGGGYSSIGSYGGYGGAYSSGTGGYWIYGY